MSQAPILPESAPFTAAQRYWLNGYFAALLSDSAAHPAAPPASGPPVTLMWGSQSGNAESLAEQFGEKLSAKGFTVTVTDMADHAAVDLTKLQNLLIVSSTWGEGDPPDNAVEFWEKLSADDTPKLPNLNFAVLGLGDSNYLDFCGMGKKFDERLETLGAKRISPRGDCDVDFEEAAEAWFDQVTASLGADSATVDSSAEKPAVSTKEWSKSNPYSARLTANVRLNAAGSQRDTRHFEISLGDSGLDYEVGDVLGVFPQNCPDLVEDLLQALACNGEEAVQDPGGNEMSLRQAMLGRYAITSPSRKFLSAFAERTKNQAISDLLEPEAKAALADYLWGREIIDFLLENPGHGLTASEFTAMLGKLTPRLYSIASSPKAHPGEVHLTVARVSYDSHNRSRKGVASTWLADRIPEGGEVPVFFQPAKHFKLPPDTQTPIIMVGPGTGIAPFRAFLEERQAVGNSGGNWLLFGNPYRKTDFLYEEQLSAMQKDGILTRLDLAWSRDQAEKIYVQNLMLNQGAKLWRWINEGAHFYVCGDAKRMAKDVDKALHHVITGHGGKSPDEAAEYVATMKKEKRYQRDVY